MLATEVSKPAVAAAGENLAANGVGNVAIARLTAEELGTAWRGERSFERLRRAGVDLAAMSFSTILVSTDVTLLACWVMPGCRGGSHSPARRCARFRRCCSENGGRPGCH